LRQSFDKEAAHPYTTMCFSLVLPLLLILPVCLWFYTFFPPCRNSP